MDPTLRLRMNTRRCSSTGPAPSISFLEIKMALSKLALSIVSTKSQIILSHFHSRSTPGNDSKIQSMPAPELLLPSDVGIVRCKGREHFLHPSLDSIHGDDTQCPQVVRLGNWLTPIENQVPVVGNFPVRENARQDTLHPPLVIGVLVSSQF